MPGKEIKLCRARLRQLGAPTIVDPRTRHSPERGIVPQAMRADPLRCERRQCRTRPCDSTADKTVYAETRQRLIESVKEDEIL